MATGKLATHFSKYDIRKDRVYWKIIADSTGQLPSGSLSFIFKKTIHRPSICPKQRYKGEGVGRIPREIYAKSGEKGFFLSLIFKTSYVPIL